MRIGYFVASAALLAMSLSGCASVHNHKADQTRSTADSLVVNFKENEVEVGDTIRILESQCRMRTIRGGEPMSICRDNEIGTGKVIELIGTNQARVTTQASTPITLVTRFEKLESR